MSSPREATRENGIRSGRRSRTVAVVVLLLVAAGVSASEEAATNGAATGADRASDSYYRPPVESSRAVLIAPGADESKMSWAPLAESLQQSGFHVLVTDPGTIPAQAVPGAPHRGRIDPHVTGTDPAAIDGRTAFRQLRDLPGAAVREFTLVGSGSTAASVLGFQGIEAEQLSFVLVSPGADWQGWTDDAPAGLRECPMLVVAAADDLLSLEASAAILMEVPQQECWVVDGRGRGVELLRSRPDLVPDVAAWIVRSSLSAGEEP